MAWVRTLVVRLGLSSLDIVLEFCIIVAQPVPCSFSVVKLSDRPRVLARAGITDLPLFHLVLLTPILLHQVFEHFLQAIRVRLQCWQDITDSSLDQYSIDHSEAFSIPGERRQCLQDESVGSSCQ